MIIRIAMMSLLCLAITATSYASGIPNKFAPGNYFIVFPHQESKCFDGNQYSYCPLDEVTDDTAFRGAQVVYLWKDLEPWKDHYDFSQIEKDLNYLQSKGKRLFIQIQDVWFRSEAEFYPLPNYLINYGGMLQRIPVGYIAKRWDPYVADRFAKLLSKLGERFDQEPYFEGINLPETAMSLSASDCAGYSSQKYFDQLVNVQNSLSISFPNTVKLHYITHWPNCGGSKQVYIPKLLAHAKEKGIGYGSPDLVTNNAFLNDTVYPVYGDVSGELPLGMAAQPSSFNKGLTVKQMLKLGMETRSLDYIFWSRSDIKTALDNYINPVKITNDGTAADGNINVRMLTGSSDALIYYTLLGGYPDLYSTPLLSSSITVPQGTTIKAAAYIGFNHSIVSEKLISGSDSSATQTAPTSGTNNNLNMLTDGDFEGSNQAWSGIYCGRKCVIFDPDRNSHVLSIRGNDNWLAAKQVVSVTAGHNYKISALIKTADIDKNARVSYQWYQNANPITSKIHFGIVTGTTPYTNYNSGVITAPQGATRLKILLKVNQGYGTAYFDDISLIDVSAANGP